MLSPVISKVFFYAGVSLLIAAALIFAGEITGLISLPEHLLAGEAAIHSIVRLAVAGCVLAAIGSRD